MNSPFGKSGYLQEMIGRMPGENRIEKLQNYIGLIDTELTTFDVDDEGPRVKALRTLRKGLVDHELRFELNFDLEWLPHLRMEERKAA